MLGWKKLDGHHHLVEIPATLESYVLGNRKNAVYCTVVTYECNMRVPCPKHLFILTAGGSDPILDCGVA